MVKIRYAELPAGLHVATEAGDRCTIVYLKPGLTREQRKDALTVARRSARFGHGPSLPPLDMAFALAADRTRTTARIALSATRKHPLLLVPVLALVLSIIAAGILASAAMVTVTPRLTSAQPSGLYEFNVGQLVTSSAGPGASSRSGQGSNTPRSVVGAQGQPTAHGRVHHGRGRARTHPDAGVPQAAPAGQWRSMADPGASG
ncbi:MAG TPA: hypothetical protein VEV45_14720 [Streptosporangiaceae bacterium]|nr:hypothetical protein [Streptosporangiaceae bacterium]